MNTTSTCSGSGGSAPTNSSPEGIASPSTGMAVSSSSLPTKSQRASPRKFPLSKTCGVCSQPFLCRSAREAAAKTCGKACLSSRQRRPKKPRPLCETCRQGFTPKSNKRLDACRFCSEACYGKWRAANPDILAQLKATAHRGKAGWTGASLAAYREKMSGPNNPAWKGGVMTVSSKGNYVRGVYVRCPEAFRAMGRRDGWILEHRLIVAMILGRMLTTMENVHHVNHNPRDNRADNLMLFASNSDHKRFERHGTPAPIWSGSPLSVTTASSGA